MILKVTFNYLISTAYNSKKPLNVVKKSSRLYIFKMLY